MCLFSVFCRCCLVDVFFIRGGLTTNELVKIVSLLRSTTRDLHSDKVTMTCFNQIDVKTLHHPLIHTIYK